MDPPPQPPAGGAAPPQGPSDAPRTGAGAPPSGAATASAAAAGGGAPPAGAGAPQPPGAAGPSERPVLATGCASLDALLDGGLEPDAVTLVFGEGGSGKTNLALQCAREAAVAGRRTVYVDTEGVSPVRLAQIFSGLDPRLEQRILFYTPYSIAEQERTVEKATKVPELGLVVVDSINMHYRLALDGVEDTEREASRSLYKQLHHLTNFARQAHVPVLITGQVYGGEDATQPFARRVMEHLVKALVRFEKRPDGSRRATILKHRSIEEGRQAHFVIGMHGLEDRP